MPNKKPKVALVEDEKDLTDIYSLRMEMDGLEPVAINDSACALAVLRREKPDLILLDIMMPELDGFALLDLIRKDKSLSKIKVYFWSNLTQKKDQDKAKKMRVDGFLVKSDFTPTTLSQKVKELLNK